MNGIGMKYAIFLLLALSACEKPQLNQDAFKRAFNECMDKLTVKDGKAVESCESYARTML